MESIQDISKSYDVYSKEAEKVEEEYNKELIADCSYARKVIQGEK